MSCFDPLAAGPARPGLADVAACAGVSVSTVSRALSRPELVSAATRARVTEAAAGIGYVVHQGARNLRMQRSNTVVALVRGLDNPFFSEPLDAIAEVLEGRGLELMIADTAHRANAPERIAALLAPGRCDGIIVMDAGDAAGLEAMAGGALPPVVLAFEPLAGRDGPQLSCDNAGGIRMAAGHLHALGHRRIAFLAGPTGNAVAAARRAAYAAWMAAAGLAPVVIEAGDFTVTAGQRAAGAWRGVPARSTAVICASDRLACGFGWALQHAGWDLPGDLSLVGFDDLPLALHGPVPLTTIRQPRRAIGRAAAEAVLAMIGGETPPDLILPVELVVRDSTAPPAPA